VVTKVVGDLLPEEIVEEFGCYRLGGGSEGEERGGGFGGVEDFKEEPARFQTDHGDDKPKGGFL